MSDFKAKMYQIQFRLGLRWGSLQHSPDPLAGLRGPTSKGMEREGSGGEGEGREGEVRGGESREREGEGRKREDKGRGGEGRKGKGRGKED